MCAPPPGGDERRHGCRWFDIEAAAFPPKEDERPGPGHVTGEGAGTREAAAGRRARWAETCRSSGVTHTPSHTHTRAHLGVGFSRRSAFRGGETESSGRSGSSGRRVPAPSSSSPVQRGKRPLKKARKPSCALRRRQRRKLGRKWISPLTLRAKGQGGSRGGMSSPPYASAELFSDYWPPSIYAWCVWSSVPVHNHTGKHAPAESSNAISNMDAGVWGSNLCGRLGSDDAALSSSFLFQSCVCACVCVFSVSGPGWDGAAGERVQSPGPGDRTRTGGAAPARTKKPSGRSSAQRGTAHTAHGRPLPDGACKDRRARRSAALIKPFSFAFLNVDKKKRSKPFQRTLNSKHSTNINSDMRHCNCTLFNHSPQRWSGREIAAR